MPQRAPKQKRLTPGKDRVYGALVQWKDAEKYRRSTKRRFDSGAPHQQPRAALKHSQGYKPGSGPSCPAGSCQARRLQPVRTADCSCGMHSPLREKKPHPVRVLPMGDIRILLSWIKNGGSVPAKLRRRSIRLVSGRRGFESRRRPHSFSDEPILQVYKAEPRVPLGRPRVARQLQSIRTEGGYTWRAIF